MGLSSQPARMDQQYTVVYAITKHSCNQVDSWTGTLSLHPWAMSMLHNDLNDDAMQLPYHHIRWELDSTFSNVMSQSLAVASCGLLSRPLSLSSLINANAPQWHAMTIELLSQPAWIGRQTFMVYAVAKHGCSQFGIWTGALSLLPWAMSPQNTPSQSKVTAKLVYGLVHCLYFLEWCWCFSTICNDDGNVIAIPSHPSRIGWHILRYAVTKFSCREL